MFLNDEKRILAGDPGRMLEEIDRLPDQIMTAWDLAKKLPLKQVTGIEAVVIAGMGGSAIGGDLICSWSSPNVKIPVFVCRDYNLPAWVKGKHHLLVASSHSGNTEETLTAFQDGKQRDCSLLAITTGGGLAEEAKKAKVDLWQFHHEGQPRAAVGYSFTLLMALFSRLGILHTSDEEVTSLVKTMRVQQKDLKPDSPLAKNPAKRLAGQLMGRFVTVFGAEFLGPVARRWKTQLNELAKDWSGFEILPEADHNLAAATRNPKDLIIKLYALFIESSFYHPRNVLRSEITQKMFMENGINVDRFVPSGESELAQLWCALHFGDYLAYYLAISYQVDPTEVFALDHLKKTLNETK